MPQLNLKDRTIEAKLVYFGSPSSGRRTNLTHLQGAFADGHGGDLVTREVGPDRLLSLRWSPAHLEPLNGCEVAVQVVALQGEAPTADGRRALFEGADGIVVVLDGEPGALEKNRQTLDDLRRAFADAGLPQDRLPVVLQINKRDLPNAMAVDDLLREVGAPPWPHVEASAASGTGVVETVREATQLIVRAIRQPGPEPRGHAAAPKARLDAVERQLAAAGGATKDLATKQEELSARHGELAIRQGEITSRLGELAATQTEIAARVDRLGSRPGEPDGRVTDLATRVGQLDARQQEAASREQAREVTARSRHESLATRQEALAAREQTLATQQAELAAHQVELATQQGEFGAKQAELVAAQEALGARQAELATQQEVLLSQQKELAARQEAVDRAIAALGPRLEASITGAVTRLGEGVARRVSEGAATAAREEAAATRAHTAATGAVTRTAVDEHASAVEASLRDLGARSDGLLQRLEALHPRLDEVSSRIGDPLRALDERFTQIADEVRAVGQMLREGKRSWWR
jgi:mutual gliding-motility protein MglA